MTLRSGARVGAYEIIAALGSCGMGEVYRARDTRLDRDVAVKILPDAFAADADRLARFQREAKTLAALNHPNIGAIHGVEHADGAMALVMELVEGEDLARILARGAVTIDEALRIASQIAEGLEAAHESGIIHRDLKPANIRVRPDGTVKVLDFGLAKSVERPGRGDVSQSPTITTPAMTEAGIVLGTAAYMSPEQARGKPLDRRTDVWSFGCVLYEMLTGRRPFTGEDVSEMLASVLAREADFSALPADVPASIHRLLRRCLQKDRRERLRDMGDARLDIRDALSRAESGAVVSSPRTVRSNRERVGWATAVAALTLVAIAAVALALRPRGAAPEMRVEIVTPPSRVPWSVAISPDARTLAYVAASEGESRLWLRALDTGAARAIAGSEGAESPFWAPDSRSVAFFAGDRLRRVDVDGGSVQTIVAAPSGEGGAWNEDGVILFSGLGQPIMRAPAAGGEPRVVPGLMQQGSNFTPHFLPDGRHFLYYVRGTPEVRGVYVGDLGGAAVPSRLLDSDSGAAYLRSGHVLFVRQGTLYAQRFDHPNLALSGSPVRVAEGVMSGTRSIVSVSRDGTIAYRNEIAAPRRQFVWFDRSGKELARIGEEVTSTLSQPALSPDGQRVVLYRGMQANPDIWMLDAKRGVMDRLTTNSADDTVPIWSPDGRRIVFSSNRNGLLALYQKPVTGDGPEELLLSTNQAIFPNDWSKDGRFVLFSSRDPKSGLDIWALPMGERGKVFPVVQTAFQEQNAQFSPDGKWIAYQSDESGRADVYIRPFPGPGEKWRVSSNGGAQVRWRSDGAELMYVARTDQVVSVPIRLPASAAEPPDIGTPVPLFTAPLDGAVQQGDFRHQYMLSADGQRILVAAVREPETSPILLILSWQPPQ